MLEVDGLSLRYGETVALDDMRFSVYPGRICGFLGPNGAGKTTAMRIVMGIAQPDAGRVRWQGQEATSADRLHFGYLPEERGLYPRMKVGDHLVYLARLHGLSRIEAEASAHAWMERVAILDRASSRVEELSLGLQQRVQLAAALTHDPGLLVLDEPFSGLDPIGVDNMSDVLRDRAAVGVAVIFSSHQLDLVEHLCDDVAVVHKGRPVMAGAVGELKRQGRRRLAVGLKGDLASSVGRLDGVRVLGRQDGVRGEVDLIELDDGVDPQRVLDAARAAGPVSHFSEELPRLSELFRRVVQE